MGNTELNLFRLKQNWNSSTKTEKLGRRFPSFLCLGIPGCSTFHHHWQRSPPALCRCTKRQRGDTFITFSFSHLTFAPQTEAPSSHHLLQLNLIPSSWEGSQELDFNDPHGSFQLRMFHDSVIVSHHRRNHRVKGCCSPQQQTTRKEGKCHRSSCSQGQPSLHNTEERLDNVPVQQGYFRHKGRSWIQAGASTVPDEAQTKRSFTITLTALKR